MTVLAARIAAALFHAGVSPILAETRAPGLAAIVGTKAPDIQKRAAIWAALTWRDEDGWVRGDRITAAVNAVMKVQREEQEEANDG